MTDKTRFRIGADIPGKTRSFLLRRFPPAHANVQCRTVTHAYNVASAFGAPEGALSVAIYGYHRGNTHDALLVRVNGQLFRPDGSRYFIALSIAPDEEPARAGDIDSDSIVPVAPEIILVSGLCFRQFPMWNRLAEVKKAA